MHWSSKELRALPAQHKHVPRKIATRLYEETILPIYEKANIKLLTKKRVVELIIGLHEEYQLVFSHKLCYWTNVL